jgi:sialidase-1
MNSFVFVVLLSCGVSEKNPFWGDGSELFEVQELFNNERLPNVVVARDGSVIAIWGWNNVRVRRSEDGGKTWGNEIPIGLGLNAGGAIVDENTGDILIFTEERHPPAPLHVYRSRDHGKTWAEEKVVVHPDQKGNVPSMCMNERGITLTRGKYAGRLLRPSRVYAGGNQREFWHEHYTNAVYSDDGGKTWHPSAPFPVMGTGEATLEELSDGRIYYNSRRHLSTDGLNPRKRYIGWSYDGGQTWQDISVSEELPDGAQHTDYGLMAGLVRLPIDGHDILLFSNIDVPAEKEDEEIPFELRTTRRIRGTVWASFDGGKTWPVKRLVDEGSFAYSSMVAGREGTPSEGMIYLFYESNKGAKIARFNLAWVTGGRDWKEYIR